MPGDDNLYALERPRPSGWRLLIGVLLLVVIVGISAAAWMFVRDMHGTVQITAGDNNASAVPSADAPAAPGASPPAIGEARVADLEQRLTRVAVAAQAASGYANRAEAIMVAFAARRALDAGQPLGYIEGQLRILFGEAQPKAVATIINAAGDPVTINKLRAGLEDINVLVERGDPKESWWSAATRALGNLVIIRRAGTPSSAPEQRLGRARRAVEAGQIEAAITEMAAMPPQPAIAQWLEQARRYNEAHRALDVIEAAAILEPRTAPPIAAPTSESNPEGDAAQVPPPTLP